MARPAHPRIDMPLRRSVGGLAGAYQSEQVQMGVVLVLAATLPMFAQVFHYMNELPPTYYMSKAWPFITLPLSIYGIARLNLPGRNIFLIFLAYALGFTPMISVIQLGNDFFDAMTTTVKAWPVSYYFALSALLAMLAPAPKALRAVMIGYGWATFALMILLFLVVPTSWYGTKPEDGKLLIYEIERGYRVYMPMFFGMILVFYLARCAVRKPNLLRLIAIPAAFVIMLVIYKQRMAIGGAVLVTAYAMLVSLPAQLRRIAVGAALIAACAGLAAAAYKFGLFSGGAADQVQESLGGSLTVRQNSLSLAFGFLGDSAMRWIFGVGAATRFGTVSMRDIIGDNNFFIADLGWPGVVFEYGIAGAVLLAAIHVWGFIIALKAARVTGDPLVMALSDYVLYLLITSAVYPLIFVPGELGVVLAVAVYLQRARERADVMALPGVRTAPRVGRAHPVVSRGAVNGGPTRNAPVR